MSLSRDNLSMQTMMYLRTHTHRSGWENERTTGLIIEMSYFVWDVGRCELQERAAVQARRKGELQDLRDVRSRRSQHYLLLVGSEGSSWGTPL